MRDCRDGGLAPPATAPPRQPAMIAFLEASGWDGVVPAPLAADASFRSYYRLRRGADTAIVMDAPPQHEDVGPYVAVAAMLRGLGLSAPAIMAEDRTAGFLLIEDFGDDTYTRLLARDADERTLYALAIDTLAALQQAVATAGRTPELPSYNPAQLLGEAALFVDWYMPAVLGAPIAAALREEYLALWRATLPQAAEPFTPTLVLRDFHIDNLMLLPGRRGVRRCGLLDFQDAVCGPPGYDLVSLLEDARRDVPEGLRREMTSRYLAAFPALDRATFAHSAAILATQRNCKILGIFTRLWRRDGKPGYLVHVPRLWRLLEADLRHPALGDIARWLDRHLPPAIRRTARPAGCGVTAAPRRAMVLAAGLGTRLRPLTDRVPKPLVELNGRTLIDHALDRLALAGVEHVVVNTHYLAAMMTAALAGRDRPSIEISEEPELLDTGGGVARALPSLGETFFVVNADVFWLDGRDFGIAAAGPRLRPRVRPTRSCCCSAR